MHKDFYFASLSLGYYIIPRRAMTGLEGTCNSQDITEFPSVEIVPFCFLVLATYMSANIQPCVLSHFGIYVNLIDRKWSLAVINWHVSYQQSRPSFPMSKSHSHFLFCKLIVFLVHFFSRGLVLPHSNSILNK